MRQSEKRESWLVLLPQDISLKGRETSPTSRFDAVGFLLLSSQQSKQKRGGKEKEVEETVTAAKRKRGK